MQDEPTNELYIKVALTNRTFGGFADGRKGLRQNVIEFSAVSRRFLNSSVLAVSCLSLSF